MILGIDLGTTNSVAAVIRDNGPELIPNALGESLTPSIVGIDDGGEILVGRAAREMQVLHPDRCMSLFKRHMGSDWSMEVAGRTYTPEMLSSLVLRSLREDAEALLGTEVRRAVISVPAYFNDLQRKATIKAGQLAGLTVERIINEPTAAAIAYGLHEAGESKIVAVIDLGGGTFDVSIVEMFDGTVEVRASSGECFLGGEDFTRTLAARVLESCGELFERAELSMPLLVSRLTQQCERAKWLLSRDESTMIVIPDRQGNLPPDARQVKVERQQFQQWTDHVLARVEMPIRRCLGDAGLTRSDISEVILVGGATRMPAVAERVTKLLGRIPHSRLNPDEVVAIGAAVQAGLIARHESLEDLVVTDVCPFTLGIETSKRIGLEHRSGYFLPIVNRNSTLPISRVDRVFTLAPNQEEIIVRVFQGENRRTENNLLLGEFAVKGIPRGPAGEGIDVRLSYDLNGVLEVEATIVATQKKAGLVITRHTKGLSAAQVAEAVALMQALKHHPREDAGNRFLLKRAERVYQELPLMQRETLGELLDAFEGALQSQEGALIELHRAPLSEFLDRVEKWTSGDADDDPLGTYDE
ncbi:MAG: Hsp70 family protein [Planctomycetia bacterium]|nr:Hsp70 family protein [Planctomycetia bacterium]